MTGEIPSPAMPKNQYTAAVIGAGRIGMGLELDPLRLKPATHFGMWQSHPRTHLAAVCDTDPEKLEIAKAKAPGIRTFTSPEKLLSEIRPDLVSIATWRDSHYDIMKLALEHGVPAIVLEKPIAETMEQAREIVDEANERNIHLLINHRRRFDPLLYKLRDDMEGGLIGEILQVTCFYVYGLVTTGTHLIDALRFFLKDIAGDMAWVSGFPNPFETFHPEDDPQVDGFIGFENGLKTSVQSMNLKDYDLFEFQFYGRRGKVVFKNTGRDIEIFRVRKSPEHTGMTELTAQPSERRGGAPRDLFGTMADNAIDCLEGRATSLSTGEDSLKALEVLLAMRESAEHGGRVVII